MPSKPNRDLPEWAAYPPTPEDARRAVAMWDAFAWGIAIRYWTRNQWADRDDLHSEALAGMLRAVPNYDPARGVMFPTYAKWWATSYVRSYLMKESSKGFTGRGKTFTVVHTCELKLGEGRPAPPPPDRVPDPEFWSRILIGLSPPDAELVRLRYLEGKTLSDIAGIRGISKQAVANQEMRAIRIIRKRILATGKWDGP